MGCGQGCVKTLLIAINVIFFLCGGAILGVGLYVRFEPSFSNYVEAVGLKIVTDQLFIAAYILIAFGAFTFLVGFLGCCGAMKDSKCMMWLYVVLVLLTLGAEIGGGVFVFQNKDRYIQDIERAVKDYVREEYTNSSSVDDVGWNSAMELLECCGVNGTTDFDGSIFQNKSRTGDAVPNSCCKRDKDNKIKDETKCLSDAKQVSIGNSSDYLNTQGCKDALEKLIDKYSTIILGVAIGIGLFEVIVLLMGIGFACNIGKDD